MKNFFLSLKTIVYLVLARALLVFGKTTGTHYVVGSNYGNSLDSNAQAMVEHLIDSGHRVVFIFEQSKVATKGVVNLRRGSFLATSAFLSALGCFYTHSLSDVLPLGHKLGAFLGAKRPKCIFLQHGIIGLKRTLANGVTMQSYLKSLLPTFDTMVVSSVEERDIVIKLGIPATKIAVTGLARFDYYPKSPTLENQLVTAVFTWQDPQSLEAKITKLLSSNLEPLLEKHCAKLQFSRHPQQAPIKRQHLFNGDSINNLIQRSTVLITDDSSIAWDMFVLGREVLFFEPSSDWLVDNPALQARRCDDTAELIEKLAAILEHRSHLPALNFEQANSGNNSKRIFELLN